MTDTSDQLQLACDEEIDSLTWRDEWAEDPREEGPMDGDRTTAWEELSLRINDRTGLLVLDALYGSPAGVSNRELSKISYRFGARIYEMRRLGAVVRKKHLGSNVYIYRLVGYREPREGGAERAAKVLSIPPGVVAALEDVGVKGRQDVITALKAVVMQSQMFEAGWKLDSHTIRPGHRQLVVWKPTANGGSDVTREFSTTFNPADAKAWAEALLETCEQAVLDERRVE